MGTRKFNGWIIIASLAAFLGGCDATTTTQGGTTTKKTTAASVGARQTGTHIR